MEYYLHGLSVCLSPYSSEALLPVTQLGTLAEGDPRSTTDSLIFGKVKRVIGVKGHISISPRPLDLFHPNLCMYQA